MSVLLVLRLVDRELEAQDLAQSLGMTDGIEKVKSG
jgi:hypothetical protein